MKDAPVRALGFDTLNTAVTLAIFKAEHASTEASKLWRDVAACEAALYAELPKGSLESDIAKRGIVSAMARAQLSEAEWIDMQARLARWEALVREMQNARAHNLPKSFSESLDALIDELPKETPPDKRLVKDVQWEGDDLIVHYTDKSQETFKRAYVAFHKDTAVFDTTTEHVRVDPGVVVSIDPSSQQDSDQWFYVTIDDVPYRSAQDAQREVGRPPDRQLGPILMWRSTTDQAPDWAHRLQRLGYLAKLGTPTCGSPI